jgi:hypothetical protein
MNVNKLLKQKQVLIAGGVVLVLIVVIAGFLLLSGKPSNTAQVPASPTQVSVLSLTPDDIGLTLTASADLHKATMKITKTDDIASIDFQLSYNANVSGQAVARGTIGHADVKTKGQAISQDMVFGTCSDVCHYDTGISDVKLIVKVTKTDGKVYQVEKSLDVSKQ